MKQEKLPSTFEFLKKQIYLPRYMTLVSATYGAKDAEFKFNLREPKVTRGIVNYFTPRGIHICISQAAYALAEHLVNRGELGNLDILNLRTIALEGRLKIIELYQKFRKEIELPDSIPGRIDLTRLRLGKAPVFKFDFEFGARAVTGNLVSIIAPKPMPQLNQDILRFNPNERKHN